MILSIIVPVYNEERLVGELLGKVTEVEFEDRVVPEIIVVNDGSSDGTSDSIKEFIEANPSLNLVFLNHEINQGKGAAVRSGMKAAKGDILIVQDADLEYDPEEIKDVMAPILKGDCKVVYGSRILREKELGRSGIFGLITGKHPHSYVLAYLGGVAITQWTNLLTGASLTDEPTCYKCFHRSALEGVEIDSDDFAWEPEVTVKLLRKGLRIHEVPISYHPRKMSEGKKIHWQDGVRALLTVWKYR
ncbi:glycosyltransferase family 2 protein [Haloferula sp.]|uniref:glycosyltransferase family 2 protein n=1 Tax=Haloferula sp. TaxID=2497595 RepID=UPI00329C6409